MLIFVRLLEGTLVWVRMEGCTRSCSFWLRARRHAMHHDNDSGSDEKRRHLPHLLSTWALDFPFQPACFAFWWFAFWGLRLSKFFSLRSKKHEVLVSKQPCSFNFIGPFILLMKSIYLLICFYWFDFIKFRMRIDW